MVFSAAAEDKDTSKKASGPITNAILWEEVDSSSLDLYNGPGGVEMKPDLRKVTFVKEDTQGHNKKYRIKDAKGRIWVAKFGREAQPETAAVRLLYGLGYKTEINYLVPTLKIPGKGTFTNARLEARPENVERLDEWKWKENPFVGTNELQGLKDHDGLSDELGPARSTEQSAPRRQRWRDRTSVHNQRSGRDIRQAW